MQHANKDTRTNKNKLSKLLSKVPPTLRKHTLSISSAQHTFFRVKLVALSGVYKGPFTGIERVFTCNVSALVNCNTLDEIVGGSPTNNKKAHYRLRRSLPSS